jgi:class 3 adenylate cyclase
LYWLRSEPVNYYWENMNTKTKRIIVLVDLAGYAKAFQTEGDEKIVAFLQEFYAACEKVVTRRSGTIIKFIGDACLAVFNTDQAKNAVAAVLELQVRVHALAKDRKVDLALGASLHVAPVIEGVFGIGSSKRRDILGRGVNQTFLLGRGTGIRISEAFYRALPKSAKASWDKHEPPAVYHLSAPDGIYEGLGKSAATNVRRW